MGAEGGVDGGVASSFSDMSKVVGSRFGISHPPLILCIHSRVQSFFHVVLCRILVRILHLGVGICMG